eukprot:TRINITY_DN44051_c0_g1_i2.p1 TRINITY_DN44051_c0_g1~~TRINITY_DN44051_c0_g1_i2.p1  ORF type:complete len:317 (+),score=34.11 TRINITY_DN44051_c0_g1_i2:123-1073(+)
MYMNTKVQSPAEVSSGSEIHSISSELTDNTHISSENSLGMHTPSTDEAVLAEFLDTKASNALGESAYRLQVQDQCSMSFIDMGRKQVHNPCSLASAVDKVLKPGMRRDDKISWPEFEAVLHAAGAPSRQDSTRLNPTGPDRNLFNLFIESGDEPTCSLRVLLSSISFLSNGSLDDKLEFCWELFSSGLEGLELHLVSDLLHCLLWPSIPLANFPELSAHRTVGRPGLGAIQALDLSRFGVAQLVNHLSRACNSNKIKKSEFCEYFRTEPFLGAWTESMDRRVRWHRWQREYGARHLEMGLMHDAHEHASRQAREAS